MKTVRIKLNRQEARMMAEILSQLIQLVPMRTDWPAGNDGEYAYCQDRCISGLVTLIWQKYYTRLVTVEPNGHAILRLPEPHALAYKIKLVELKTLWLSEDHEQLGAMTYQQIDQAI